MLPQSIYWKHLLCQHLFAFLGGQGEQWFYLPQAYSPVQEEKQISLAATGHHCADSVTGEFHYSAFYLQGGQTDHRGENKLIQQTVIGSFLGVGLVPQTWSLLWVKGSPLFNQTFEITH